MLMRYGLSLIKIYKAALKSGVYKGADSFWQSVQGDAATRVMFPIKPRNRHHYNSGQTRKSDNYRSDLSPTICCSVDVLHDYAFDVDRGAISKIMRPMNVSRNSLSQLKQEAAGAVREVKFESPYFPSYKFDSQSDKDMAPSSEHKKSKKEAIVPTVSIAESVASYSTVLTENTSAQLLALCCPHVDHKERIPSILASSSSSSMYNEGLYLVFSTAKDGFSLSSLYEHTKGLTPLVILVKSTCFSSSTPVRDYTLL